MFHIAGFTKFSLSDYPGRTAAIVFTRGCNYDCPFCHNRRILHEKFEHNIACEDVLDFLRSRRGLVDGLVITGGEPCIHSGLLEFCREAKSLGMAVKLDTNGSRPAILRDLLAMKLINYVAMDLKAPIEKYDALCGKVVDKQAVLESMALLTHAEVSVEFRTTAVPGLLDEDDIMKIGELLQGRATHYLQFFTQQNRALPTAARPAPLDLDAVSSTLNRRYGQTHVR